MVKRALLFVALCTALSIGTNSWAATWLTVKVDRVGLNGTTYVLRCTDAATPSTFSGRNFIIPTDSANQMVALALTAQSSGGKLYVGLSAATEYSSVQAMYSVTP